MLESLSVSGTWKEQIIKLFSCRGVEIRDCPWRTERDECHRNSTSILIAKFCKRFQKWALNASWSWSHTLSCGRKH